jgi:hypothetical protein
MQAAIRQRAALVLPLKNGCGVMIRPKSNIPSKAAILRCILVCTLVSSVGCNFFPDVRHKPQYHNPFPQIQTVAILPFRNQSQESTVSGSRVTLAYYDELQSIPGFEVIPVGVIESQLIAFEENVLGRQTSRPEDFQKFAQFIGADAVLQGAITDYQAYYPPRMTLKVNWYAANEGFHPIPPGYGLPWGTKAEKKISESIRLESERALAREQLQTQTPEVVREELSGRAANHTVKSASQKPHHAGDADFKSSVITVADLQILPPSPDEDPKISLKGIASSDEPLPIEVVEPQSLIDNDSVAMMPMQLVKPMPERWPDPQGFIPPPPKPIRPTGTAQSSPIISHMKAYNGGDEDFTESLSDYYYFRDDARFGGWEAYLQRSEDFIRFCCHQHIVETLAARGGQLESRTVVRWPINRYER